MHSIYYTDCDTDFCYIDCKKWYANGYTTSGVYTINPDEGTPFEVCVSIIILKYIAYCIKFIVIWKLMVVGGLSSREEWMDQLISISIGLIMRMVLAILMENSGWD